MSELGVDCFVIATDVSAVFPDWGTPQQRETRKIAPAALARHAFAAGFMGPKVQAASSFVLASGRRAVIGSLDQIEDRLADKAGTEVSVDGSDD